MPLNHFQATAKFFIFILYISQDLLGCKKLQPMIAQSLQSCLILCDPMDCSPPCSSVHGILQARILEWVVMPSSRSSQSRDQTLISWVSCVAERLFTSEPPEKPQGTAYLTQNGLGIRPLTMSYVSSHEVCRARVG